MSDPVADALAAYHESRAVDRLKRELERHGRLAHWHISRHIVRDESLRRDAIARLVESGVARVEVQDTRGRPATYLVKT